MSSLSLCLSLVHSSNELHLPFACPLLAVFARKGPVQVHHGLVDLGLGGRVGHESLVHGATGQLLAERGAADLFVAIAQFRHGQIHLIRRLAPGPGAGGGDGAHLRHVRLERLEDGGAAARPGVQRGAHLGDVGVGAQVAQRRDADDLHALPRRVELGVDEPRVDGRGDERLELRRRVEAQAPAELGVGEVLAAARGREREEAELAQLEALGVAERRQAGRRLVRLVVAVGEDAEQGQVRLQLRVGGRDGLDLRRLEELCEYVRVGRRGGSLDEVGGRAGRGGRL